MSDDISDVEEFLLLAADDLAGTRCCGLRKSETEIANETTSISEITDNISVESL